MSKLGIQTLEVCQFCGRRRLSYIDDPHCTEEGRVLCNWTTKLRPEEAMTQKRPVSASDAALESAASTADAKALVPAIVKHLSNCTGNGSESCWHCAGEGIYCGCDDGGCPGGDECDLAEECIECEGNGYIACPGCDAQGGPDDDADPAEGD